MVGWACACGRQQGARPGGKHRGNEREGRWGRGGDDDTPVTSPTRRHPGDAGLRLRREGRGWIGWGLRLAAAVGACPRRRWRKILLKGTPNCGFDRGESRVLDPFGLFSKAKLSCCGSCITIRIRAQKDEVSTCKINLKLYGVKSCNFTTKLKLKSNCTIALTQ